MTSPSLGENTTNIIHPSHRATLFTHHSEHTFRFNLYGIPREIHINSYQQQDYTRLDRKMCRLINIHRQCPKTHEMYKCKYLMEIMNIMFPERRRFGV